MIIFRYILTEIIKEKGRWAFVFSTLVLGFLGYALVSILETQLQDSFSSKAQEYLSGDLVLSGRKKINEDKLKKLEAFLSESLESKSYTTKIYTMGKVKKNDAVKTKLIHITAVDKAFPLIGTIESSGMELRGKVRNSDVYISKDLSVQLELGKGDRLTIGKLNYEVKGVIDIDTTRGMSLTLAPYALVHIDSLKETGLLGSSSLSISGYYYKLNKELTEDDISRLKSIIDDPVIKVTTKDSTDGQLLRVLRYLGDYLRLIGLSSFLLALLGLYYILSDFFQARSKDIGLFKSLGFSFKEIRSSYFLTLLLLSVGLVVATLIVCLAILPSLIRMLNDYAGTEFVFSLPIFKIAELFFIAILGTSLLCLPILKSINSYKISDLLFKLQISIQAKIIWFLPFAVFVYLMSVYATKSWFIGTLFFGIFFSLYFIILFGLKKFLPLFFRREISDFRFNLGIKFFLRDLQKNYLSIFALSSVLLLIIFIQGLSFNLGKELSYDSSEKPVLFLFDIQPEQIEGLTHLLEKQKADIIEMAPMVQARLIKKNGEKIERMELSNLATREEERARNFRNRTVNLSYKPKLGAHEKLIKGRWFDQTEKAEVSLEVRYAKRIGASIGDKLTFEILGVEIETEVTSLREVRWLSFTPNFFIVFKPGFIEDAPQTFVSAVGEAQDKTKWELQGEVVDQFSNISIVDVQDTSQKIVTFLKLGTQVISFYMLPCLLVALALFYMVLQNYLGKIKYQQSIQNAIGMSRGDSLLIFLSETSLTIFISFTAALVIGGGVLIILLESLFNISGALDYKFLFVFGGIFIISSVLLLYVFYKGNERDQLNILKSN